MSETTECLTPRQVARILALATSTVYQHIHRGELPAIKVGRSVRIVRSDFDQWLREKHEETRS